MMAPALDHLPRFAGFCDNAEPAADLAALLADWLRSTWLAAFAARLLVTLGLVIRSPPPSRVRLLPGTGGDVLTERNSRAVYPVPRALGPSRPGARLVAGRVALQRFHGSTEPRHLGVRHAMRHNICATCAD
jgi:hypothetical protein